MRHAGALGGGGLRRAEVEAAIDLHRIHRDDFAAERFGERERKGAFPTAVGPARKTGASGDRALPSCIAADLREARREASPQ